MAQSTRTNDSSKHCFLVRPEAKGGLVAHLGRRGKVIKRRFEAEAVSRQLDITEGGKIVVHLRGELDGIETEIDFVLERDQIFFLGADLVRVHQAIKE